MLKLFMFFKQLLTRLNNRHYPLSFTLSKKHKCLLTLLIVFLFFITPIVLAAPEDFLNAWSEAEAARNEDRMEQANWVYHGNDSGIYWANGALNGTNMSSLFTAYMKGDTKAFMAWRPGGINGSAIALAGSTFVPSASGVQYLAMLKDNLLGINKPVYAQGIGANGFAPLLPLWQTFRNAIYVIAALFFIIIGIMISLRVKISPQAVINVQNALPNIITTLILVTFSYAIAGLVIDISYFLLGLVLALIFASQGKPLTDNFLLIQNITQDGLLRLLGLQNVLKSIGLGTDFANLVNPNIFTLVDLLSEPLFYVRAITSILGVVIGTALGTFAGAIAGPGGAIAGGALGFFAGGGIGIAVINLVISIIIFVSLFRFIIGLIKAYFTIVLKIVFAPIEVAMGAVPGSKMGFNNWLFELFANVSIFPFTIIFLVIVNYLLEQTFLSQGLWFPINMGVLTHVANPIPAIVSFAAIILLPRLPEMIPQIIYSLKPSPWGTAIGEGLATVSGAPAALYASAPILAKPIAAGYNKWRSTHRPAGVPENTAANEVGNLEGQNSVPSDTPIAQSSQANNDGQDEVDA